MHHLGCPPAGFSKDASQPAGPTLEEALAQVDLSEDEVDPTGEAFRENWHRDEPLPNPVTG